MRAMRLRPSPSHLVRRRPPEYASRGTHTHTGTHTERTHREHTHTHTPLSHSRTQGFPRLFAPHACPLPFAHPHSLPTCNVAAACSR